jgi:hypothetical protein
MSSRPAAFSVLAAPVVLGVLALASLVGCGGSGQPDAAGTATPTTIHSFAADAADAGVVDSDGGDAAAPVAAFAKGSPLCHSNVSGCFPDDVVNACSFAIDGGVADAAAAGPYDDDAAVPACHVVMSAATGATPTPTTECLPSGLGFTNGACTQASDCAAGHECVSGGLCRHYCCAGTSACQVNEFCDVQPTAEDPTVIVPVCMPEVPCELLDDGYCPASQQCSVVREDGSTSCVNLGTAQDGDSCDAEHCARGLVCLGAPGSATCAPLCYTSKPDACAGTAKPGRTCVATLPLFHSSSVGVCQ